MKRNLLIGALCLIVSNSTFGATARMVANVHRTLIDEGSFGNCMVRLNKEIAPETGLDCKSVFVTFSCSGDFISKDIAYKMFDSAQMALALESRVVLTIDDSRKHNGYCLATRIDALR